MRLRSTLLGIAFIVAACGEHPAPRDAPDSGSVGGEEEPEKVDDPKPWRTGGLRWSASSAGMGWLGRQQAMDGGWEERTDAQTATTDDPYLTGLVAVTHLLNAWTHRGSGDTGKGMRRAMGFLVRHQDEDGRFAPRDGDGTALDHVVPTVAFVRTYAMTGSLIYRPRVQRALDHLTQEIRSAANLDAEMVGWSLLTLVWVRDVNRTAREPGNDYLPSGLHLDEKPFQTLKTWCEVPSDADDRTRAVAALARIALDPLADAQARVEAITHDLASRRFSWNAEQGMTDPVAGIFAAIAMQFVAPSEAFILWNQGRTSTEAHQERGERGDPLRGSWNPRGLADYDGGRVRLTALCTAIEGLRWTPYTPWRIERIR